MPSNLRTLLAAVSAAILIAGAAWAAPAPTAKSAGIDLRLEVARQWEQKGEFEKAVQELRLYLSEHPENPGALYVRIGRLRLKQGNYKLAGENFKIALAKDSNQAEARAGLALAYEKQGDKAKAEEERKKWAAPSAAPSTAEPAPAQRATGDELPPEGPAGPQAAASHAPIPREREDDGFSPALDSGESKGPEGIYADQDFLSALEFYKAGRLDEMAGPLRRCLARHPGHPGAYYLGGVMRYDKGEYSKALFNFKRALAYPDRGFNAHFYLGRIYQRQNRLPQAAAEYRDYLKAARSERGRKQAAASLSQIGEGNAPVTEASAKEAAHEAAGPEAAEGAAGNDAGERQPGKPAPSAKAPPAPVPASAAKALVSGRDGGFLFLIPDPLSAAGKKLHEAHLLVKNDKYEKAIGALKEIMLAYGGSDEALAAGLDLASVYLQLGLWEQARDRAADHLGQAARDSVKFYDAAQYLAALASLGLKDGDKAEKALLRIKPGSADGPAQEEVDFRLAQAGALMNDPKKASGYLEKGFANAKDPARKAGYARDMAGLHAKYGSLDKALGWYAKASAVCDAPKDSVFADLCAEVRLRQADLAYRKKDWKGAMAQYRQFASTWPEHKESAWVHYQMANIYKSTGNFESALNEYKRVIDNYADSYWASQAKWKREDAIWRKEYEEVLD